MSALKVKNIIIICSYGRDEVRLEVEVPEDGNKFISVLVAHGTGIDYVLRNFPLVPYKSVDDGR